jgi:hypothetical protein
VTAWPTAGQRRFSTAPPLLHRAVATYNARDKVAHMPRIYFPAASGGEIYTLGAGITVITQKLGSSHRSSTPKRNISREVCGKLRFSPLRHSGQR